MIKRGTTRLTILIGKFAIKIPIINRSLKHFVKGWLGNVDERDAWRANPNVKLCPIYFSFFGLMNVMPRARAVTHWKFEKQWALEYYKDCGVHIDVCSGWKNFGYIGNQAKPVLLDYATCRESNDYCSDCDNDCILKSDT